ncbi:UDP-glucose:undecaprenyl-phosphate glucose-1-phosphate transferase [Stieleria neptunia]|uniref:UDP-glucose:undecaprenyl-phosphate glucose-1-phosphate transferase n=1 Tax=Stieleria neptunia TaxID=2527979 RepID=A0A518HLG4_9BACT|nr:sugar transferase [Stieleria neptunia]QDV41692.1 UDP-glucose:undecaprenyl-phosphate glucose-1-phosphate transferase [Stieleria neptunia]
MLAALINRLQSRNSVLRDGDSLLLTRTEFNREVSRERIRATRRSIPFCIVTIDVAGGRQLQSRRRALIRTLHRNVRLTDQKADLGNNRFAVLLVDTPEMGGRSVLDRLAGLCETRKIDATLSLRVHDPEGFDPDRDVDLPTGGGKRRRDDAPESSWLRVDRSSGDALGLAVQQRPAFSPESTFSPERGRSAEISSRDEDAATPGAAHKVASSVSVTREALLSDRPLAKRLTKRAIDLAGASIGLVLVSPVLVAAAVAVKLTSPGPAFFKQTREGMGGKPFTIYKMRTMVVDAESKQSALRQKSHRDGPAFKIKHDPRVTPIGHLLRKTCIDELPQFINVLRGDMSLVGPRPLPWHESRACNHWQRRRLDVPPGMTCYWQVNKAAAETFDDWMRMDLQYVDRNDLWRDLRLIARTALVPLTGRGGE